MHAEPLRLNIACGTDIRDDFCNIDVVEKWPLARRACDVIWDAESGQPLPFPDGSAELAYLGTLLLHIAPDHHERVLRDVHRCLKPGGLIVVSEVETDEVFRRWLVNPRDRRLAELVWGEQGGGLTDEQVASLSPSEFARQKSLSLRDKHCHGYTEQTLRELMERCGFPNARRLKLHGSITWYELTLEAIR